MWKEALDFDLRATAGATPVKTIVSGRTFHRPAGGLRRRRERRAGRQLVGQSPVAGQSLRLRPARLESGPDRAPDRRRVDAPDLRRTIRRSCRPITAMQLSSWRTYENYTGPLGLQTLTDIVGNHYGVAVEASERNGWGQWHRADDKGVGMDRTVATGTGFIGQYRPAVQKHVRVARRVSRRPAAVHAPRAVHARAARRHDRHPVHLRLPLRRCGCGCRLRPSVEDAQGPDRRRAIPGRCSTSSNIRPARRSSGATPCRRGFSARLASRIPRAASAHYPGRLEAEVGASGRRTS